MITDDRIYWIWLSSIPCIGAKRFYKLLELFENPKNLFMASNSEISRASQFVGSKATSNIKDAQNNSTLDKAASILNTPGVNIITIQSDQYPPLLKTIFDPPPVLYLKGGPLSFDNPAIAIVGSRRSSTYGRSAAEKFSSELARAGVTIVSGMARGIDTMAHKGALKVENSYTIAVLGCGVDYVYPPENVDLYNDILENGTVISEYPPGTSPSPGNFPARNRIISGLSKGTFVIEAGVKSGALITVDFALEQGRDVYAMPGNVNSLYSAGTNKLIKEGAKVVTSIDDILEDLEFYNQKDNVKTEQNPLILDFYETQVYNALEDGEKSIEELIVITGIETGKLNALLTMMEIKGIIKQSPGKIFEKQW